MACIFLPTVVFPSLSNDLWSHSEARADVPPGPGGDTVDFPLLLVTAFLIVFGPSLPSNSAQVVSGADQPPHTHTTRLRDLPVTQT